MPVSKNAKISTHLNYRIRCTLQDDRQLVGTFKAFDRHMNLILCDCDEFRTVKNKNNKQPRQEKRSLGLVLLRGEHIVSMNVDGPPPPEDSARVPLPGAGMGLSAAAMMGVPPPGMGRPVGRSMPLVTPSAPAVPPPPPSGLAAGPTAWAGVGVPNPALMQPRAGMPPPPPATSTAGAPAAYGRPGAPPVGMAPPPPPPGGAHPPY
ncbi:hypothetical protein ACTXT7_000820 [Hymenolepis weldensis]